MAEQQPDDLEPEADGLEPDADTGGGILSEAELDALLAAAEGEGGGAANGLGATSEDWMSGDASASSPGGAAPASASSVVELPEFDLPPGGSISSAGGGGHGMGRVRDIPLDMTVELGRTRLLIRDILELGAGSIIELDKLAGEPVDLFANGLLVARGEVIVIDDNFGVRVTEIITAAERRQIQDAEADAVAA